MTLCGGEWRCDSLPEIVNYNLHGTHQLLSVVLHIVRTRGGSIQDLDPLQDTLPPRYAIESEDSDDEQLTGPARRSAPNVSLKYTGKLNANLLILIGQAGEQYGSGIRTTGSAIGSAHVDDVQVSVIQSIANFSHR